MENSLITKEDLEFASSLFDKKSDYDDWEHLSTCTVHNHEIHIRRKEKGEGLYQYFAFGSLPLTKEEMVDINWDQDYRTKWDSYCKEIKVIENVEHEVGQEYIYWEVAFPWPLSNRDYVFLRHKSETEDKHHVIISKGAKHDDHGEKSGVVRVEELTNYAIYTQHKENPDHCEFAMLYFDDLKGSIPTWVVNWAVSKAIPSFLTALIDASNKKKQEATK